MKKALIFGFLALFLVACASLTSQIGSEGLNLDQAIKVAYNQSYADLEGIRQAFESGNTVKTHQAITTAQKDLKQAFDVIQKLDEKLDKTATKAATKGDSYNKEHGFTVNPFSQISLGLGIAIGGVVHVVLLVGLIVVGLAIASVFFPALGPVLSAVYDFFHLILTSIENVGGVAASGVQKLLAPKSNP